MPELPEVETVCRTLRRHLVGQCLDTVEVLEPRLRWPVDTGALTALVHGRRVIAVRRRAKYILIDLRAAHENPNSAPRDDDTVLAVHLGMSGIMRVTARDVALRRHDHVVFRLLGRAVDVRFNDPRRFGSVHSLQRSSWMSHPLFAHLGVEPLDPEAFDGAYLRRKTRGVRKDIKLVIMDARVVVGVGNIYASEALWRSGISPRTAAGRLSGPRLARLAEAIVATLRDAIEQGGTTLRDFSDADAATGHFAQRLQVYGRQHAPCYRCGSGVRRIVQGARSTFYCSTCQKS